MVEKLEFICNHPELVSTIGQEKPLPAKMVGSCEHNQACPVCGWGWGCAPDPCVTEDGIILYTNI